MTHSQTIEAARKAVPKRQRERIRAAGKIPLYPGYGLAVLRAGSPNDFCLQLWQLGPSLPAQKQA
jgi:hypothetical protein